MEHNIFDQDDDQSFRFSDEEESTVLDENEHEGLGDQPSKFEQFKEFAKKYKILLVIGVLIVVFLFLQLVSYFSADKQKTHSQALVQNRPQVVNQTSLQQTETLQQIQALVQSQNALTDTVNALVKQNSGLQQQINDLQKQTADDADQIRDMQTQLGMVSQNLTAVARKDFSTTKTTKVRVVPKSKHLTYYVEAVIPGRAWLIGSNGVTITVSPGDKLPGYGRVTRIDANTGIVRTTTGAIIRFAINEN